MAVKKEWFEDWFDSPYYHLLYSNRDESEARNFIDRLINFLQPEAGSYMLDLACGKGRHAKQLAEKGFKVTGIDLSEKSILSAKAFESERLKFFVHDMRKLFYTNYFDYAFNFFTSFGYFDRESDNIKTLQAVNKGLKPGGVLTIDFLNVNKTLSDLQHSEQIERSGVVFHIDRKIERGFIIKDIKFSDKGKLYNYQEKVQAIDLDHFKKYMAESNFSIQHIFGNYALDAYDEKDSERLIIIAKKKNA
ncbi:MAG: class I SAM-dependent methyltransferase [Chitinophagales bacterium]